MKWAGITAALLIWLAACAWGADPVAKTADFASYVNAMLDQPALRGASWSVLIRTIGDDSTYFARDSDRRLTPASVAKLVTSAAALDALGPDFQFETTLSSATPIGPGGVLNGDLIVQASGDPTIGPKVVDSLHASVLRTWADALTSRGLKRVKGNIVLRTWPFRLQVYSPDWEVGDVNDRFGPPVDGFGFNSNVCQVGIFPGASVGDSVTYTVDPPYTPLAIRSQVVTGPPEGSPDISLRIVPEDTVAHLSGVIPLGNSGQYLWVAVQNPALFFGRALQKALSDAGIEITGDVVVDRTTATNGVAPLFVYRSPPLSEVMKLMNKESDNFVSESVLRVLGVRVNQSSELRPALDAEARFLREIGVDDEGIELRDGCGLARQDLVSARGIVDLLKAMYVHPSAEAYLASMAVSGVDGTIGYRMSNPELIGKVHAKTGTINHVSNLAGYISGDNGQVFLFAILCNNFPSNRRQNVRHVQDSILERLYSLTAGNVTNPEH